METNERSASDAPFHRKMAVSLFNETWTLLDKANRTPEEDARMIHMAHASRLHWEFVGSAENYAVGEWQVSRVHAVLGQPEPALYHARLSLEIATRHELSRFHLACGHEAVARALSLTDPAGAAQQVAMARRIALEISDPEDKKILAEDLATIRID